MTSLGELPPHRQKAQTPPSGSTPNLHPRPLCDSFLCVPSLPLCCMHAADLCSACFIKIANAAIPSAAGEPAFGMRCPCQNARMHAVTNARMPTAWSDMLARPGASEQRIRINRVPRLYDPKGRRAGVARDVGHGWRSASASRLAMQAPAAHVQRPTRRIAYVRFMHAELAPPTGLVRALSALSNNTAFLLPVTAAQFLSRTGRSRHFRNISSIQIRFHVRRLHAFGRW